MTSIIENDRQLSLHSKNLDFIRSIAVLLVVARHLAGEMGYTHLGPIPFQLIGIFGVMLFFVLTAHVLMFSMSRIEKHELTKAKAYKSFFIRRAFRIYPLSIATVAVVFIIGHIWSPTGFINISLPELAANFFLIQNLTGGRSITGPLWSLPIEIQMYLLLPVIYFFISKRPAWRIALVYFVFLAVGLASIKAQLLDVLSYSPWFIPGILAYWIKVKKPKKVIPFYMTPILISFLLLLYGYLGKFQQTAGGYPICIALGLALPFLRDPTSSLINKISEEISKYSYGIYLIHMPTLYICFQLEAPVAIKILIFIIATAFLSVLSYRYIEAPMIALSYRFTKKNQHHPETIKAA